MAERLSADHASTAGDGDSHPAIPAATIVVIREGPSGLETLLMRRDSKISFGGMWVFPGGKIDGDDHRDDDGGDPLAASRRAAVREAGEEGDLDIDVDSLVHYSHWLPPPEAPKRFSTWFFLAAAPKGAAGDVTVDGGEIKEHAWRRPADALARRDAGDVELAVPTWMTLHELSARTSVGEALAHAAARPAPYYVTHIARSDEGMVAMWPGDAGYPARDPATPGDRHRLVMTKPAWRFERTAT